MYEWFIRIASLFNDKARLWVKGRAIQVIEAPVTEKPVIWMHCSSLGEFEQGRPVLEQIQETGRFFIVLSFFSPSGFEIRKNYKGADHIYYLPSDTQSNAKHFIETIKPRLALFVKYDLWFNYLRVLNERKVPVVLFAALFREQQYFFKPYGKYFKRILQGFDRIFVQNVQSKTLLEKQAFNNGTLSGDTRIDRVVAIASEARSFSWLEAFKNGQQLLIAGSTWPQDEDILLEVYEKRLQGEWKMVLAPHDISEGHVSALVNKVEYSMIRHSDLGNLKDLVSKKIMIIDNIGMLNQLYRYAEICYIGGGFGGGIHNTLEPIAFGKPVLFGPKYEKFEEAKALVKSGGGFSINSTDDLIGVLKKLESKEKYKEAASKASSYINENKGASQQVTAYIMGIFENRDI